VAAAIVQVRDQVLEAVVFDVRLPEAVWMRTLEADVGSLPSRLVGSGDQVALFEDFVHGAAAYLDVLLLVEVCGDGFTAPSFTQSNLNDSGDGFLG